MAKILIVDDEFIFRLELLNILTDAGHEVIQAFDVGSAVAKLKTASINGAPIEAAVSNWRYPGGGGEELLRVLRHELHSDVPVIVVSSSETVQEMAPTDPSLLKDVKLLSKLRVNELVKSISYALKSDDNVEATRDALPY